MDWLLFKFCTTMISITVLIFPIFHHAAFLLENIGRVVDTVRMKQLRKSILYMALSMFIMGYGFSIAIDLALEMKTLLDKM